jgi:hypothetical protein
MVRNMTHTSPKDPAAHYSVQGVTSNGTKVKGGHVPEDANKQTVSFPPTYLLKHAVKVVK